MVLKDFYSVIESRESNGVHSTTLKINPSHEIYKGHFPGRPVTPGVILMQLFKEEAERLSRKDLRLNKASNVKFTAVVNPNEDELLVLRSSLQEENGVVTLRGTAENNNLVAIKIQAEYQIEK
jgi:3-hydroxyacyl-[acyl-carrier-protein] dehydratase